MRARRRLFTLLCLTSLLAVPAWSQTPVETGYTEFEAVDGGGRECRIKDWVVICGLIDWLPDLAGVNQWVAQFPVPGLITPLEPFPYFAVRTLSNPSTGVIGAAFTNFGYLNIAGYDQFGTPHYASSWVYKDISIADPSGQGNLVEVQISPTYSWEGGILGGGNYEGRFSLAVEVEDISEFASPVGMGGVELVSRDRSGDIGIELPAAGTSSYDRNSDTDHFEILLRRGGTYRIYFKAEAYGSPLLTAVESAVRARLESLGVSVRSDVADQLAMHDAEIKAAIAAHDVEIKALLQTVMTDLEEIKALLETPPGRRPGFPRRPH